MAGAERGEPGLRLVTQLLWETVKKHIGPAEVDVVSSAPVQPS
jgi:hypothetical protein